MAQSGLKSAASAPQAQLKSVLSAFSIEALKLGADCNSAELELLTRSLTAFAALQTRSLIASAALQRAFGRTPVYRRAIERGYNCPSRQRARQIERLTEIKTQGCLALRHLLEQP